MFKVIIGGLIGGLIAIIWSFISWGVFSWHDLCINKFCNQEHVARVIQENTSVDGVYIAPSCFVNVSEMRQGGTSCQKTTGPFVYVQVKKNLTLCSPSRYIYSFILYFIGASLIGFLLLKVVDGCYRKRLFFVTMVALLVGILELGPNWIWFGSGYRFALIMTIDILIQWFLIGLFLAKFVQPQLTKKT